MLALRGVGLATVHHLARSEKLFLLCGMLRALAPRVDRRPHPSGRDREFEEALSPIYAAALSHRQTRRERQGGATRNRSFGKFSRPPKTKRTRNMKMKDQVGRTAEQIQGEQWRQAGMPARTS